MKILIIANSSIVFGNELKEELEKSGYEVFLLDFQSLNLISKKGVDEKYSNLFKPYKNISKLHMLARVIIISKLLKREKFKYVNIHYNRWIYSLILRRLKKQKLIITFYGSDFYRTSKVTKLIQKKIYNVADALTFTNPQTKQSFTEFYNDYEDKSFVCRFGLKTLHYIDKNIEIPKNKIKEKLGYKTDKTTVTCGYNATLAQQHRYIIQELVKLPKELKNKIQFIFPMTYGDMLYKQEIKKVLQDTDLDYLVLEKFLYDDENAYVKLASDIMINLLKTDSFSGSMQEFLYAKNYVITGSWLPYKLFDKEGIAYYKIKKIDQLNTKLVEIMNFKNTINFKKNTEIIYKLSHWKNNVNSWIKLYEKN